MSELEPVTELIPTKAKDEFRRLRLVTNAVNHLLTESVSIMRFGAKGDGSDDTSAIQATIDSLPATGGAVLVPEGDFSVTHLRLDGTDHDKSNVTLYGVGNGSTLRQLGTARASDVPSGDTTQSPNVVAAYYGSGFRVRNLRIIGNKDSGGVKPTLAANWVGATAYTFDSGNPTYRQTRADGTAVGGGADLSTDRVWRLLSSHTSDATDIDVDVALGRWAEVTNFAALNGYYYDESFARGMCVYFGGPAGGSEVTDISIEGCRIEGAYYANVLVGSGPAKTGIVQAGARNIRIANNSIHNSSAGIGGLLRHDYQVASNTVTGVTGNGINADQDGSNGVISTNTFIGDATLGGRNGVSSYRSDHIVVTGNYIQDFETGVNFQDTSSAANLAGSITGNTIVDCGQIEQDSGAGNTGIVVGSSDHVSVSGNHIRHSYFNGIKVSDSNGVAVTGNTVYECGAFGINFEDCAGITCTGNNVRQSGRDNFYFEGTRSSTVSGNLALDGNVDDSATLYSGFRIGPFGATESSNVIFTANFAADTRTPKRQHYGLNIESATTNLTVVCNDFTTNKTAPVVNAGSSNCAAFNDSGGTASLITESTIRAGSDQALNLGSTAQRWLAIYSNKVSLIEGITLPGGTTGHTHLAVATDGWLKLVKASGRVEYVTGEPEVSAAAIAAVANTINTANKYAGKRVWDTTNNRMVRASGSAAADPWHVVDGSATVTPS